MRMDAYICIVSIKVATDNLSLMILPYVSNGPCVVVFMAMPQNMHIFRRCFDEF